MYSFATRSWLHALVEPPKRLACLGPMQDALQKNIWDNIAELWGAQLLVCGKAIASHKSNLCMINPSPSLRFTLVIVFKCRHSA